VEQPDCSHAKPPRLFVDQVYFVPQYMPNRKSLSSYTILAIMLAMTVITSNINWGKNSWKSTLEADAKGYYSYLPAVFIYQDLNFGFFDRIEKEKYYNENLYYEYRIAAYDKVISRYYCGTAMLELPFFFVAHGITKASGGDADGYSKLYPVMISLAALFYLLIGLIFVNSTLKLYGVGEWRRALILTVIVFGTNLFYYTIGEPGTSHIFSFCFVAVFFYCSKNYFMSGEKKYIWILGLLLGLITLIRPVNAMLIFILPFTAGNWSVLQKGIRTALKNRFQLMLGILYFFIVVSVQFLYYKLATGHFFVYSYGTEKFDFMHPHMCDILFSYRKGLFLYTPIYLLSFAGLFFFLKKDKFSFFAGFIFFLLITYVFSSWWMWYYGGSFSSRVYVELLPIFAVWIGVALNQITSRLPKIAVICTLTILTVICQIQTYQYRYYQIHWSDMNKEKYWKVFLRLDDFTAKQEY
jgi:hypothetical protein